MEEDGHINWHVAKKNFEKTCAELKIVTAVGCPPNSWHCSARDNFLYAIPDAIKGFVQELELLVVVQLKMVTFVTMVTQWLEINRGCS